MRVMVIASGSKGNCTYVELEDKKILIDLGISRKRIVASLENKGIDSSQITDVLITHEHSDHVGGFASFLAKSNANIYLSKGTLAGMLKSANIKNKEKINEKILNNSLFFLQKDELDRYKSFSLGKALIEPIPAFHDSIEAVGFVITQNQDKMVYLTDTGYVHESIIPLISNANCYIFECNHDPEVLMNSERPYELKMRILSNHGHLSNEDSLHTLALCVGDETKYVFYAHISDECNVPALIGLMRTRIFNSLGISFGHINFMYTSQECTECIKI